MSDSVGSVSVDVVPDARGWSEKLRAQIRDQSVKVKADAETGEAESKLDEVARDRKSTIKAEVDKSGLSKLDEFASKMSLLPALFVAAGAAAVPLVATLGAVTAALAAPLAIAGGGATLFALLGGAAITQTEAQAKKLATLKKSVDSAQASLESARRTAGKNAATSTSVANAQVRLNKATEAYRAQLALIGPSQKGFLTALQGLKDTFTQMLHGPTGKALLEPFTDGLNLLSYLLRAGGPVIRAAAGAFHDLFGSLQQAVNSPGFEKWVHRLASQVGPDIVAFGHIIGNFAEGLGGLFSVLDGSHFSGGVLHGLERITHNFAEWGNSKAARHDVREFFGYVRQVGPQVAHTLGALAHASGQIIKALAPLGPPLLKGIEVFANSLSAIPTPVMTALAAAFLAFTAFAKVGGFKAIGALGSLGGKGGLGGGIGGIGRGVVPVFVTNPGFGGAGGPGGILGGTKGLLGKAIPGVTVAGEALTVGGALSVAALTIIASGAVYASIKDFQIGAGTAPDTKHPSGANMTPADWLKYNQQRIARNFNLPDPYAIDARIQSRQGAAAPGVMRDASAFDALRTHAQRASQTIDQIGPHSVNAFAQARGALSAFTNKLDAIHDKKLRIIAETDDAIRRLQQVQAFQIRDKSFTVYQRQQIIERVVGPGGGQRQLPHGSAGGGAGGTIHTHVHLDGKEIGSAVTPYAQRVYDQNQRFEVAHR